MVLVVLFCDVLRFAALHAIVNRCKLIQVFYGLEIYLRCIALIFVLQKLVTFAKLSK